MEWIYLVGVGLNAFGYMRFIKMAGPMDNTPALSVIKLASSIGGLVFIVIGFAVFQWWVPVVGLVFAPAVLNLILSTTPFGSFPPLAVVIGHLLSLIGVLGAL